MKKIEFKNIVFILLMFLLFPVGIKALEKSSDDSKIWLINQGEEVYIGKGEYSFTFANAEIDPSLVEYIQDENYYLHPDSYLTYSKGSTKSNVVPGSTYFSPNYYNDQAYYKSVGKTYRNDYHAQLVTYKLSKDSSKYNSGGVYIYYPNVGTYNGKTVGLKVTLTDYMAYDKINNNYNTPTISFLKNQVTIAMYGLNSVDLKYEFYDSECYDLNKSFNTCHFDSLKGYGTLKDIDGSQAVKLGEGIDSAYIYKTYDSVCRKFDVFKGTYAENANSKCEGLYTNSVYNNGKYSFLLPNLLPLEATGSSSYSGRCDGESIGLKSFNSNGVYINNTFNNKEIKQCYQKVTNAITSPWTNTIDSSEYAWATVIYNSSFDLTYYFGSPDSYANREVLLGNTNYSSYVNGYGGEFTFSPESIVSLFKKSDLNYRTIDTDYPFLDLYGQPRTTGRNWCSSDSCESDNSIVNEYIKNRPNSNGIINLNGVNKNVKPLYSFTLTPDNIKNIRKYNSTHSYDEFLVDDSGHSLFIKNLTNDNYAIFNSSNSLCGIETKCNIDQIIEDNSKE